MVPNSFYFFSRHKNYIISFGKTIQIQATNFAQLPFYPVTHHGLADLLGHGKPNPGLIRLVFLHIQHQVISHVRTASTVYLFELSISGQSISTLQQFKTPEYSIITSSTSAQTLRSINGKKATYGAFYAVNLFLPLALLALITLRPPAVDILFKNPCTFLCFLRLGL